jgi:phosphohistidine phosphatase
MSRVTRRVYFLRHGKAVSRAEWDADDDLRPLTEDGERVVRAEARGMKRSGLDVSVIVTSPLARARRTAEIVAEELGLGDRVLEDVRLAHGFDLRRLAKIVAGRPKDVAVMVVGHEPEFSATISAAIGGGRVEMKKGALARVDFAGPDLGNGVLAWLATPAQLAGE